MRPCVEYEDQGLPEKDSGHTGQQGAWQMECVMQPMVLLIVETTAQHRELRGKDSCLTHGFKRSSSRPETIQPKHGAKTAPLMTDRKQKGGGAGRT